ncbi:porin [Trinickia terrae]|uniref:Porin n=1 Tax=Trinickia terrae TaxID=2571161 RepID=A0A4U1HP59_9BURK|nr:porin [Trinickia terrae]TKC81244.1 porin [Trinickia terrae]
MKKLAMSTLSLALLGAAGASHAQSSVSLYGVIDDSVQYVNRTTNASGTGNSSFLGLAGGNLQGPRWGLKGQEELGNGLKTIFQLENGFDPNVGTLSQGSREFGRQAYVGLTHDSYGTFTMGRQYDPVVDLVQGLTADNYWGSTFTTPGDVDNNDNSSRTNNSLKYASPTYAGFQYELFYALGGVAGAMGSGQTWSLAATYATGPFSVAAGYIVFDNTNTGRKGTFSSSATSSPAFYTQINSEFASAKSVNVASLAGQYVAGPFTFGLRYSNALYKHDAASSFAVTQRYDVGAGFANYQISPVALVGLGYTFTHGKGNGSQTYNQVSLGGDYNLSKRTDVYLVGAYQRAGGEGVYASVADYGYASTSKSQAIASLGIRHKF